MFMILFLEMQFLSVIFLHALVFTYNGMYYFHGKITTLLGASEIYSPSFGIMDYFICTTICLIYIC